MIRTAFIHLWNMRAGAVAWDARRRLGQFEFDPAFLARGLDLSPLHLPINKAAGQVFSFPGLRDTTTFRGLPGLLADVLPDRYGHTLINAWLARNGRPADSLNPIELLCFIGQRGMGALEFEPIDPEGNHNPTKIELDSLIEVARQILNGRKSFRSRLSQHEARALSDILKIGTSAGGARAKAVLAYNEKTGEVRSGQSTAPKGFSHWLLKFDGVTDTEIGTSHGYGRVEMAYHLMALEAGIEMSECRLLEENGRAHFMTRRFDRPDGGGKLHLQSFCALAHADFNNITDYSYEQLFETMRGLFLPYHDAEQMFLRMAFNVAARNCDDHTKNFAFLMDQQGTWSLAPAFDLCHAYRPGSNWVSQHSLSINGKRQGITAKDLLTVAAAVHIKKPAEIIARVNEAVAHWTRHARQTAVPATLMKSIAATHIRLK